MILREKFQHSHFRGSLIKVREDRGSSDSPHLFYDNSSRRKSRRLKAFRALLILKISPSWMPKFSNFRLSRCKLRIPWIHVSIDFGFWLRAPSHRNFMFHHGVSWPEIWRVLSRLYWSSGAHDDQECSPIACIYAKHDVWYVTYFEHSWINSWVHAITEPSGRRSAILSESNVKPCEPAFWIFPDRIFLTYYRIVNNNSACYSNLS